MAASKPPRAPSKTPRKASKPARKTTKRSCSPAKPAKKKPATKARKAPAKRPVKKAAAKKKPAKKAPAKPSRTPADRNIVAALDTIDALDKANKIGATHAAVVTLVVRLAAACDVAPDNATLWREYRQALAMLLGDDKTEPAGEHDGPSEMDRVRRLLAE